MDKEITTLETRLETLINENDAAIKSVESGTLSAEDRGNVIKSITDRNVEIKKINGDLEALKGAGAAKSAFKPTSVTVTETGEAAKALAPAGNGGYKSIGRQFVENPGFKANRKSTSIMFEDPAYKAATKSYEAGAFTATENPVAPYIHPGIIEYPFGQNSVTALFGQGRIRSSSMKIFRETLPLNTVAMIAMGAEKPDVAFNLEGVNLNVGKAAGFATVPDEALEDIDYLESFIDNRLRTFEEDVENNQALNGTNEDDEVLGILKTPGIQSQIIGTDSMQDAIFKAITKVQLVAKVNPDAVVMNPIDYLAMRLAKDENGQYLAGGPFYAPYGNGPVTLLPNPWGLRVVLTAYMPAGKALVGAFKDSTDVLYRNELVVESTKYHADDFKFNRTSFRVERRLLIATYKPLGYCLVKSA